MKFHSVICALILSLASLHTYGVSLPNPVANADGDGFARIVKQEFSLDDADTLRLFYLEFFTNPTLEPGMFGAFWHMPAFSSKVVQQKSNELEWHAPDGNTYYFCAHLAEKKGKKIESFVDNTSAWRAVINKDGFKLVSLRTGATFTYTAGRLTEFMLKDKRRYIINYDRNSGMPLSVKGHTGMVLISFDYMKDQKHVKSIKNFQGVYNFAYDPHKAGDIFGSDNFYGNALLLSKIEHPDKVTVDEFVYSKILSRSRTLLLKDLTEVATKPLQVRRMAMKTSGEDKGWVEWCAVTGLIMADNGGTYMIGNDRFDSFFPNFRPGQGNGKFSAIKYASSAMPYPEIWMSDFENYYEIFGSSASGEILRESKIGACGLLKYQTRKTEKLEGSLKDGVWILVKANSFDAKGRLVRELYGNGDVKEWVYKGDSKNGSVEEFLNSEAVKTYKYKNGDTIYEMRRIGNDVYEAIAGDDFSKISIIKNGNKIRDYEYDKAGGWASGHVQNY